jgi:hypothetical protein
LRPLDLSPEDKQLLPEQCILCDQASSAARYVCEGTEEKSRGEGFSPLLDELSYLVDELFPSINDESNHAAIDSKWGFGPTSMMPG